MVNNGFVWKVVEIASKFNPTNLAAGATEEIFSGTQRVEAYNFLTINNGDDVDIEIFLDSGNKQVGGRNWIVRANSVFQILPEEGIWFKQVVQKNLHASTAEVTDKIFFSYGKSIRVG